MNKFNLLKGLSGYYRPDYLDTSKWMHTSQRNVKEERRAFIRKKCGGRR